MNLFTGHSLLFVLALMTALMIVQPQSDQWMYQSDEKWDKEWAAGEWDYMEAMPIERSRIGVIGGVFTRKYASSSARVLDVGCGEGAISDFLLPNQSYVGLDLSKEAIRRGKIKRPSPVKFVHLTAHEFQPLQNFDVIIFSEVLYYVAYEKIIDQYIRYLNPSGIMIISIFHKTEKLLYQNIFEYARKKLKFIDEMDISGYTRKSATHEKEKTALRIEVYRK